jgi:hypothetical protein
VILNPPDLQAYSISRSSATKKHIQKARLPAGLDGSLGLPVRPTMNIRTARQKSGQIAHGFPILTRFVETPSNDGFSDVKPNLQGSSD